MWRSWAGTLAAWVVLTTSCGGGEVFACLDDEACAGGVCQPAGFCSFPDEACETGQRFGEFAGEGLAGMCVGAGAGTSTGSGSATTGQPLATTTGPTTAATTGTSGPADSSTGPAVDDSGTTGDSCPGWWDCAWSVRVPITVTWRGASQSDFPARVFLDSTRFDLSLAAADGADIRFVDADDNLLPHEIEVWSPRDGEAEIWVLVPSLQSGQTLWMYAGALNAPDGQDPAAVWSNGFLAVWHLGPDAIDSAGGTTLEDTGTQDADGQIGRARSFDGVSQYMRPDPSLDLLTLFEQPATISAWIRPMGWGQAGFGRIVDMSSVNTSADGWSFSVALNNDGGNPEALRFGFGYTSSYASWRSAENVTLEQWQHVAVSYEGGDPALMPDLYVNGVTGPPLDENLGAGMPDQVTTAPAAIGAIGSGDLRYFDGQIDELRVSTVGRSAQWLAAEHADGADMLLIYGALQTAPR